MQERKQTVLDDNRILKLLLKLSTPATIGMIVMALYNIVDTIFVGHWVGARGIAGIAIVFPFQMLMLATGNMLGIGGASMISRSLGSKDYDRADTTLGNTISVAVFLGIIIALLGNSFLHQILQAFGSTETIFPYAREYMSVILLGSLFFIFMVSSNNIIRSEGRAKIAMGTMLISALINIILDPIFIYVLDLGVEGAAIATVISQAATTVYIIYYFTSGRSSLKLTLTHFIPHAKILKEQISIGISGFFRQAAGSLLVIIINNSIAHYGSDLALAAFGIIHRLLRFTLMPIFGIAQGMQPIVGFNYGARKIGNALKAIRLSVLAATLVATLGFTIMFFFPHLLLRIFTNDVELIELGQRALKLMFLALPIVGIHIIGSTTFLALGKALPALLLSISRQIIVLIPLVLILPRFYHLDGIWIAFPISDIFTACVTSILLYHLFLKLKKIKKAQSQINLNSD